MSLSHDKHRHLQRGFTLIELSIVLVIIGLIVGGVLVGQDLIKAAQIRAEVTQLERYNTAVNTFRGKYNGLPGDLLNATNFFTSVADQAPTVAGEGNGDNLIQSISAASTTCASLNCVSGEGVVFWYELNQANLIPDSTTLGSNYTALASVSSSYIPNGKIAGTTVSVNAANGINYWVLANQAGALTSGVPATNGPAFSPSQAYQIDTKIDDGVPNTGTVLMISGGIPGQAGDDTTAAAAGAGAAGSATVGNNCGNEAASGTAASATAYNIALAPNTVSCQLGIRTNF